MKAAHTTKFDASISPPGRETVLQPNKIRPQDKEPSSLIRPRWLRNLRSFMRRLHDPTVGPTGRSDRSVRQLDRVNGRPTGRPDRSDESNMSNSSNRSDQQLHRLNVHPTIGPTIGPIMQMRSPNQPIKSTYNHDALNDVIFLSALHIIIFLHSRTA